jgi:EAL domain-containing protein (putative c-di-GMP-specific phosphodiesterase class I)/GGDEF domain-containing protein
MKKHALYNVFLLCSVLLFSNSSFANSTIKTLNENISNKKQVFLNHDVEQNLGKGLYYFEDKRNEFSLDSILKLEDSLWLQSLVATPNFGYTDSSYWFHIQLNSSKHSLDKILAIQYALLDYIELFVVDNGEVKKSFLTGDTFPFAQRPIRHRDFLFPLQFKENQSLDVYFKVKTQGSLQVPLEIWEREKFIWKDQDEQLIKAIYYGMLLVLVVYNLFLFLSIRERSYLYYGGLVVSVLTLMSGAYGFLYQYIYPTSPYIHKLSMLLAVPSVMLFAGLFSSYFLSLPKVAPRLSKLLLFFNSLFALSMVGAFFLPYDISTRISVFLAIPSSLVIMFAGPYAWHKGQTSASFFTYAWAFLITGIVVSASSKFGFLPRNSFTEHALSWGSAIEALLLSFALADRFNRERQDKIKAQQAQLEEETQRKTAEENLYTQATHESLDGFPNSVLFQQVVHRLLYVDSENSPQFSLFYIHLGGIQEISKTLGHANADIVLGLFSKRLLRLKNCCEKAEIIEATDHNEFYFAHLEKGLFAHVIANTELNTAVEYAHELMTLLAEPIEYKGMKLDLGLSMGIACCPIHGKDIDTLTRHARVAIDSADNANGQIGVYSSDINPYTERRLVLMGELKKAIDNNTLALHYQPIISCSDGEMIGAEALLRWNHESLGFIPPDEFIASAEQTGIMRYLTRWVFNRAFCDHALRRRQFGPSTISVNISAINLHEPDFEECIIELLEKYKIPPEELILEITETSVMKDPEYAIAALKRLSNRCIKLAIDDFGTGYSSLTYIQQLPLYEIKIDRSFIQHMDKITGDQVIVKTTLNLSKDLGYKVVAEGIENQAALNTLRKMKCDFAQGYHIARPMTIGALIRWQDDLKNDEFFTELKSS